MILNRKDRALRRLEAFAERQQEGGRLSCPRCGEHTMHSILEKNATSRAVEDFEIYICDDCRTDETLRDYFGKPIQLADWRAAGGVFRYGK